MDTYEVDDKKRKRLETILTKRGKVPFSKTKVNLNHLGAKVSDDSANLSHIKMPVAQEKYMVEPIFPVPVYKTSLFNVYREEHQEWVSNLEREANNGNDNSVNKHVLEEEMMLPMKRKIMTHINTYFETVIQPFEEIEPYITQSWVNWTDKNHFHTTHRHTNSVISGVVYLHTSPRQPYDMVTFAKNQHNDIEIPNAHNNMFNSNGFNFDVHDMDMLIFPSSLYHGVPPKMTEGTRVSLAFNVFVKGILGHSQLLNEIKL